VKKYSETGQLLTRHAENENIILKFLWEAIEMVAAIMTGKY